MDAEPDVESSARPRPDERAYRGDSPRLAPTNRTGSPATAPRALRLVALTAVERAAASLARRRARLVRTRSPRRRRGALTRRRPLLRTLPGRRSRPARLAR